MNVLETERLILRPWKESDAPSLYEYAKDERVGPIAGWYPHTSIENSLEIIHSILMVDETYAVCLKADNQAIGSISLRIGNQSNFNIPQTDGEIGYWIGVPFWGQGLIPEAVRELLRHGFVDLNLKTIWCGYFDGNEKSKRVQEKCGFVYHHTEKDIHWKIMDDIRTEHITNLTKENWKNSFAIRKCTENEINSALDLAWKVFQEYESPVYSKEGTEEFYKSIHDEKYLDGIEYYGAFDNKRLIGEIGIRPDSQHICFFFVDGKYHRLGIGTKLFHSICEIFPEDKITLNSSPYGLGFYHFLGFIDADTEKTIHGIRFTPMVYERK